MRRVRVLLLGLPAGARVWQARGEDAGWSLEAHLANRLLGALTGERLSTPSEVAEREARRVRDVARAERHQVRQRRRAALTGKG